MQFFASCPPGVADLTAAELRACGATQTREFKLGVQFEGTLETAYRACLWSRTASRILHAARERFPPRRRKQLYEGVSAIDWAQHLGPSGTLAIEFGGIVRRHHAHALRRAEDEGRDRRSAARAHRRAAVDRARAARRAHRCATGSRPRDGESRSLRREFASSRLSRARRRCAAEGKPGGRGAACAAAGRRSRETAANSSIRCAAPARS